MIDTHVHLCSTARYAELEAYCDALGITRCALVSLPDLQIGTYNAAILHALRRRLIGMSGSAVLITGTGDGGLLIHLLRSVSSRNRGSSVSNSGSANRLSNSRSGWIFSVDPSPMR